MEQSGMKYDIIVSSDTVYNADSIESLLKLIKTVLSPHNGHAFVSGRRYYFGVGGGTSDLSALISKDSSLKVIQAEDFANAVGRETLDISFS